MNFRRKTHSRRIWRKMGPESRSLGSWSRMLHKWWKQDVLGKIQFKREYGN